MQNSICWTGEAKYCCASVSIALQTKTDWSAEERYKQNLELDFRIRHLRAGMGDGSGFTAAATACVVCVPVHRLSVDTITRVEFELCHFSA